MVGLLQPFFAMELVNGLPDSTFCDEARLSLQARWSCSFRSATLFSTPIKKESSIGDLTDAAKAKVETPSASSAERILASTTIDVTEALSKSRHPREHRCLVMYDCSLNTSFRLYESE